MDQLHRRFTVEQVKVLLQGYCQGTISRADAQEILGIGKTRFFALLQDYRLSPQTFAITYTRDTPARLSASIESAIETELRREQGLVEDRRLPISDYNYSAICDRLKKTGITVSATTITDRAKKLGCYRPHRKGRVHDREVVTAAIGALVQHDASLHLWSPYAAAKWTLITSLDDYSRKLLFADFFEQETAWAHIQAAQRLMNTYGLPMRYYVDNLRVFRFVQGRDSYWRKHILETDEVDPQWRQVMRLLGVDVTYALSAQAKGKIERPYRWLQDRIVRTCALEHITSMDDARTVLKDELERYNHHQVHSTTGQVPDIRFANAKTAGNSLFRPFALPKPYTSPKDVFCLTETRVVDGYRRIALFGHEIQVPNVPLREEVQVHLIPNPGKQTLDARIWWNQKMVQSVSLPLSSLRVHF
jgi:hypothetical protein